MAQTNAIVWLEDGANNGKHVVAIGGWAQAIGASDANDASTSTSTDNATGVVHVVGTMCQYVSGSDTTHMQVGFAVPEGAKIRAHVWCLLAPGETN